MQRKQLTIVIVSLLVVVLSVSLAYFTTQIIGKKKDVSVTSTNLQIVFTDSDGAITGNDIEPGWSTTKTFTVENKSKETYKYNIVIKDLINTFVTEGYLQYKITSTNNGYNMTDYVNVPKSSTATDTILAKNVSIAVSKIQTYTIEFRYVNDKDVDQGDDMGKVLKGTLFITEGSTPTLAEKLLEDNPTVSERKDFTTPFTTNTKNTLYKAKEDNTDVYYFAGADAVSAHCEYNDKAIIDNSSDKLNETTCTGKIQLCHEESGDYLYFGTASCNGYEGTVVESEVTWMPDISKPINNWVRFGKNSSNQDLYWRIIRTNADGSVRLLYHGTSTTTTNAYIGTSEFNTTSNDPMYVGYMYGTSGSQASNRTNTNNSTIKTAIDNWYASNMTSYTKYLSTTAVYCNDRSNPAGGYNTGENTIFYYAAYTRLNTNKTPSYDCTTTEDKFTVDSSTGNGKLIYPIALMTADEISYAGDVFDTAAPMWYYTNSSLESSTGSTHWWSLSPSYWVGSYAAGAFLVGGSSYLGFLGYAGVNETLGVRPVTSLKSCVKYASGDGTASNPYTLQETSTGC